MANDAAKNTLEKRAVSQIQVVSREQQLRSNIHYSTIENPPNSSNCHHPMLLLCQNDKRERKDTLKDFVKAAGASSCDE
jgi:hypothetical protein